MRDASWVELERGEVVDQNNKKPTKKKQPFKTFDSFVEPPKINYFGPFIDKHSSELLWVEILPHLEMREIFNLLCLSKAFHKKVTKVNSSMIKDIKFREIERFRYNGYFFNHRDKAKKSTPTELIVKEIDRTFDSIGPIDNFKDIRKAYALPRSLRDEVLYNDPYFRKVIQMHFSEEHNAWEYIT